MFENIGRQSVAEARAAVKDLTDKLEPLTRDAENRLGGILHGLLDRFEIDVNVHFKLNKLPKATEVKE